ncbi:testis-specific serine/threonine-protein kinase 2-like [Saccoglossus kowalevskii]
MEKAAHGDLLEHIKKNGSLPEGICKSMFRQLVDGLKYLHAKDVVHRDLKCENLLLDECDHLKVADFGFARVISDTKLSETFCGSAAYAPPEILQGIPYHPKSAEIWSMGVILYIMLVGMMPYDDSDVKAMIKVQLNSKVSFPEKKKLTPEVKALVHWMLEPRLDKRASLDDILASDWFNS